MLRSLSGFKAQYHDLTLRVVQEFNEWRVLVSSPDGAIQGQRQFSEAKAKDHAFALAKCYLEEIKHRELPEAPGVEWVPTTPDDWLVWSA